MDSGTTSHSIGRCLSHIEISNVGGQGKRGMFVYSAPRPIMMGWVEVAKEEAQAEQGASIAWKVRYRLNSR